MPDETDPTIPEEQPATEPEQTPDAAAEEAPVSEQADASDDTDAMTEALLAQVNAAVEDVNSGIITEPEQPAGGAENPMDAAAEAAAAATAAAAPAGSTPMDLPSFPAEGERAIPAELDLLSDVNLNVKIELGRTRLLIDDVLRLNEGAVVELDKLAGDPVDIYVNDRHIARGEVLVLNDNFCVRINEIVDPEGKQVG